MRGHCEMEIDHEMFTHLLFRQLQNGCCGHGVGKHGHHRGFGRHRKFGHHYGFGHNKCSGHFGHHGKFSHHHHHEYKGHLLEMLKQLLSIVERGGTGHDTSPGPQDATTSAEKETTQRTKCSGRHHWGRKHWRMLPKKPSITTSRTQTCDDVHTVTAMVDEADDNPERCDKSFDIEEAGNSKD